MLRTTPFGTTTGSVRRYSPAASLTESPELAAATALACGALQALAAALSAQLGRASVDVVPDFGASAPEVALTGMLRLRAGQIIAAAARSGADNVSRRISKWTDTRSKAS